MWHWCSVGLIFIIQLTICQTRSLQRFHPLQGGPPGPNLPGQHDRNVWPTGNPRNHYGSSKLNGNSLQASRKIPGTDGNNYGNDLDAYNQVEPEGATSIPARGRFSQIDGGAPWKDPYVLKRQVGQPTDQLGFPRNKRSNSQLQPRPFPEPWDNPYRAARKKGNGVGAQKLRRRVLGGAQAQPQYPHVGIPTDKRRQLVNPGIPFSRPQGMNSNRFLPGSPGKSNREVGFNRLAPWRKPPSSNRLLYGKSSRRKGGASKRRGLRDFDDLSSPGNGLGYSEEPAYDEGIDYSEEYDDSDIEDNYIPGTHVTLDPVETMAKLVTSGNDDLTKSLSLITGAASEAMSMAQGNAENSLPEELPSREGMGIPGMTALPTIADGSSFSSSGAISSYELSPSSGDNLYQKPINAVNNEGDKSLSIILTPPDSIETTIPNSQKISEDTLEIKGNDLIELCKGILKIEPKDNTIQTTPDLPNYVEQGFGGEQMQNYQPQDSLFPPVTFDGGNQISNDVNYFQEENPIKPAEFMPMGNEQVTTTANAFGYADGGQDINLVQDSDRPQAKTVLETDENVPYLSNNSTFASLVNAAGDIVEKGKNFVSNVLGNFQVPEYVQQNLFGNIVPNVVSAYENYFTGNEDQVQPKVPRIPDQNFIPMPEMSEVSQVGSISPYEPAQTFPNEVPITDLQTGMQENYAPMNEEWLTFPGQESQFTSGGASSTELGFTDQSQNEILGGYENTGFVGENLGTDITALQYPLMSATDAESGYQATMNNMYPEIPCETDLPSTGINNNWQDNSYGTFGNLDRGVNTQVLSNTQNSFPEDTYQELPQNSGMDNWGGNFNEISWNFEPDMQQQYQIPKYENQENIYQPFQEMPSGIENNWQANSNAISGSFETGLNLQPPPFTDNPISEQTYQELPIETGVDVQFPQYLENQNQESSYQGWPSTGSSETGMNLQLLPYTDQIQEVPYQELPQIVPLETDMNAQMLPYTDQIQEVPYQELPQFAPLETDMNREVLPYTDQIQEVPYQELPQIVPLETDMNAQMLPYTDQIQEVPYQELPQIVPLETDMNAQMLPYTDQIQEVPYQELPQFAPLETDMNREVLPYTDQIQEVPYQELPQIAPLETDMNREVLPYTDQIQEVPYQELPQIAPLETDMNLQVLPYTDQIQEVPYQELPQFAPLETDMNLQVLPYTDQIQEVPYQELPQIAPLETDMNLQVLPYTDQIQQVPYQELPQFAPLETDMNREVLPYTDQIQEVPYQELPQIAPLETDMNLQVLPYTDQIQQVAYQELPPIGDIETGINVQPPQFIDNIVQEGAYQELPISSSESLINVEPFPHVYNQGQEVSYQELPIITPPETDVNRQILPYTENQIQETTYQELPTISDPKTDSNMQPLPTIDNWAQEGTYQELPTTSFETGTNVEPLPFTDNQFEVGGYQELPTGYFETGTNVEPLPFTDNQFEVGAYQELPTTSFETGTNVEPLPFTNNQFEVGGYQELPTSSFETGTNVEPLPFTDNQFEVGAYQEPNTETQLQEGGYQQFEQLPGPTDVENNWQGNVNEMPPNVETGTETQYVPSPEIINEERYQQYQELPGVNMENNLQGSSGGLQSEIKEEISPPAIQEGIYQPPQEVDLQYAKTDLGEDVDNKNSMLSSMEHGYLFKLPSSLSYNQEGRLDTNINTMQMGGGQNILQTGTQFPPPPNMNALYQNSLQNSVVNVNNIVGGSTGYNAINNWNAFVPPLGLQAQYPVRQPDFGSSITYIQQYENKVSPTIAPMGFSSVPNQQIGGFIDGYNQFPLSQYNQVGLGVGGSGVSGQGNFGLGQMGINNGLFGVQSQMGNGYGAGQTNMNLGTFGGSFGQPFSQAPAFGSSLSVAQGGGGQMFGGNAINPLFQFGGGGAVNLVQNPLPLGMGFNGFQGGITQHKMTLQQITHQQQLQRTQTLLSMNRNNPGPNSKPPNNRQANNEYMGDYLSEGKQG